MSRPVCAPASSSIAAPRTLIGKRTSWSRPTTSTRTAREQQQLASSSDVGAAAAPSAAPSAAAELVDRVLSEVRGSDGGAALSPEARARVDGLLDELTAVGDAQQPRPLDGNPLLWGNYEVRYTSVARASAAQQRGEPAGGRFRSKLGRLLFQTTGVFQSVLQLDPPVATNKVAFKLFGLIPGYVGLRGAVEPLADDPARRRDTAKVFFDRPVLSFGAGAAAVTLRIGPPSSVQLTTTYLDERVRLGKGSRGSLFVFERTPAADAAAMDRVGLEATAPGGAALLLAALAAIAVGGCSLFATRVPVLQAAAAAMWLVAAALAAVFWRGGIVGDEEEARRRFEAAAKQQREAREARAAAAAAAAPSQ